MKTFFWKVWRRLNLLTAEVDNDCTVEVSTVGNTKRNEDIAQTIIEEGSKISFDTLVNILNRRDRVERRMVQQGNSVQTGNVWISPRVSGAWIGSNANFDPSVHKITLDVAITADMRTALEKVGVGVFFVNDAKMATPVTRRLTQNAPKKVLAHVPAGEYTLRIVTRHSNSPQLLKELRVIESKRKLKVNFLTYSSLECERMLILNMGIC